jgi:hypothetical protein
MSAVKFIVKSFALIITVVTVLSVAPCFAQEPDGGYAPDKWQDWQLTLTPKTYDHYLDYPTSSIHSMVKVSAGYLQPPNTVPTAYEDFYYTSDRVIGSKLKGELGITPGTAGIIKVVSANPNESYAVANAVLRIYLDLFLNKCMLKYVLVPGASLTGIKTALCMQRFHPPLQPGSAPLTSNIRGHISLQIVSDVDGSAVKLVMP